MRLVDDRERRARLATRHGLHPAHRTSDPVTAARSVVCLHATEAATVHLAVGARTSGVTPFAVDEAMYTERSLVKQLAMRRTLFAFPRDLLPAALGVAVGRIAPEQRRLVSRDAARHGVADDGDAWLDAAGAAVLAQLSGGGAMSAKELREALPELAGAITVNEDKRYGGTFNLAPRVLGWLGAEGKITRGPNAGHWLRVQPRQGRALPRPPKGKGPLRGPPLRRARAGGLASTASSPLSPRSLFWKWCRSANRHFAHLGPSSLRTPSR
ncbi:DNA glycosylase AlkZ-like family protein [Janibacter terrae]|uniref:DNA glycosylase AlkZ-like family protein n=1 Tax=Janibacter terrae TaxID=103817 RepID=UPI0031F92981